MSIPLLEVSGVDVTYGRAIRALRGVSLRVAEGSVVTVLGSNGAGKTTLVRAITRSLAGVGGRQDAGTISFDGQDISTLVTSQLVHRGLVLVPEGRQVFRDLTVEENLQAGGFSVRHRRARDEARQRVFELFPILFERRRQKAGLLSGGQQQMLAIGRALMVQPRLLLLDEPSLGLAPRLVDQMGEIITRIHESGASVLVIEQNAAMGLRVADQAYVLSVGEVTAGGAAAELATGDEVREHYLGRVAAAAPAEAVRVQEPQKVQEVQEVQEVQKAQEDQAPGGERRASPAVLSLEGVTMSFRGITALDAVDLVIEPRTVHALIGPNGAGKSTCINILSGVYRPTLGRVAYGDHEIGSLPAHRVAGLGVARTFQNIGLSGEMSVRDVLLLGRHRLMRHGTVADALRLPRARRAERAHWEAVEEIAELLTLAPLLDRPVQGLSYGYLKRVELGRALAARPQVLLLDEPVAGMAHGESQEMAEVVQLVQRRIGLSILLVEHDMPFVMGLAERVTVLDFGRVVAEGTPAEVQRHPDVIRAYLGAGAA